MGAEGRQYIKHHMFDFGSILGSGTNEEDLPWVGHEYVVEGRPAFLTLASLGLWRRPFMRRQRADRPAGGRQFHGGSVRAGAMETALSQPGVREHAAGGRVLGGAAGGGFHAGRDRARSSTRPASPTRA